MQSRGEIHTPSKCPSVSKQSGLGPLRLPISQAGRFISKENLFLTVLAAEKSKINVPVDLASGENPLPGSQLFSSRVFTQWEEISRVSLNKKGGADPTGGDTNVQSVANSVHHTSVNISVGKLFKHGNEDVSQIPPGLATPWRDRRQDRAGVLFVATKHHRRGLPG